MRLNLSRTLFTCDLNLMSVDIVPPKCLWSFFIVMGISLNVREGTFGAGWRENFCCDVLVALNVINQSLP